MKKSYQTRSVRALFEPTRAGAFELANRIVMAPLTRNRAGPGLVPGPFALEYYVQRATAGLIIAEATQISDQAQGYAGTPGCFTDDQVRGWRKITDAVHAAGGTMVVQLWHTGRVSHTSFQKDGQAPVAPSAIRANTNTFLAGQGFVDVSMPRALRVDEIPGIIEDFRYASTRAIEAGFDGVELHGAHGYLLDAFLRDGIIVLTPMAAPSGTARGCSSMLPRPAQTPSEPIASAFDYPRSQPPVIHGTAIRRRSSIMSSRASTLLVWPICTSWRVRRAERGTVLRSITPHCMTGSMVSGWSTMAMTGTWRLTRWRAGAPTWCHLDGYSWPIRTWWSG